MAKVRITRTKTRTRTKKSGSKSGYVRCNVCGGKGYYPKPNRKKK